MSEKWTDGPWRVGEPDEFGDIAIQPALSQLAVAVMVNGEIMRLAGRADEHAANAHLIAAAPDLYGALKQFTGAWLPNQKAWAISEMYEARDKALKAMAKARGEQQ